MSKNEKDILTLDYVAIYGEEKKKDKKKKKKSAPNANNNLF